MNLPSAVVVIPTYNRNEWLNELLVELKRELDGRPSITALVIDNSPQGGAEAVCAEHTCVSYIHEPVAGIVAARNRALDAIEKLDPRPEYVVFIDDDEIPSVGWLQHLLTAPHRFGADAAIGPVEPILPSNAPSALKTGGFFDRIHLSTGATPPWGTTNNTVISTEVLFSLPKPVFDPAFSVTGGSDADLFWRLREMGHSLVWVEEALVYERFNVERANWRWISKRNIRLGNVSARLQLRKRKGIAVLGLGLMRILFGLAASVYGLLRHRVINANGHSHLFKGIGMVLEIAGKPVLEYRRPLAEYTK